MATVKEIKKGYCDEVFTELSGIKNRIVVMRDKFARTYSAKDDLFGLYDRHLRELIEQIDWKLQILSHACPYDWKGSAESEYEDNTVSVGPADTSTPNFAGGYLGG
jgi:hypothetical protein